jgi:hypothetical protein
VLSKQVTAIEAARSDFDASIENIVPELLVPAWTKHPSADKSLNCYYYKASEVDLFLTQVKDQYKESRTSMKEVATTLTVALGGSTEALQTTLQDMAGSALLTTMDELKAEDLKQALEGYGMIALQRFADVVPMACLESLHSFPQELELAFCGVKDLELDRLVQAPPNILDSVSLWKREIVGLQTKLRILQELR